MENRKEQIEQIISRLMSGEGHLSYSSLSAFIEAPNVFIDYKLGQRKQTDAMIYGAMVHCLVLEPEDFANRYHCLDDADICNSIGGAKPRATKQYKEWREVALQEAGKRILVEMDDYNHAKAVANNVLYNRASKKVIDLTNQREVDIEWNFKNFKFVGKIDGMGEKAMFDLKTCADAEPSKFQRDLINMGYYIQAAMYRIGSNTTIPYYIIAVDKSGGVSVHQLDENLIEYGMKEYSEKLDRFNECILTDSFNQSYDFWSKRYDGIYKAEKPNRFY